MMRILKRNQIIVLVIALMLVSAGYLSSTTNNSTDALETSIGEDTIEYAGIGDAKLVSSNVTTETDIGNAVTYNETNTTSKNNLEVQTTNSNISKNESDEYFSVSYLNRETMYSQMIESYQKILENQSISADQKAIAQTEIQNINNIKNRIMICENLIKTKGIENVILFVNDKSISVVVKAKTLEQEQIAQIQNIISREMQTEIDNIHISNKN